MPLEKVIVKGAREHNLKNVDVEIPRDQLVVITGVSGSGKSSLALDTIYAEGQRRYVESLSAYARQFLGQMEKPDVDYIEGLSPAISIDQKSTSRNPRSTVGTITEIYDYLRLLFARIGHPHCPICGREIERQSVEQIVDAVVDLPEGSRILILAPVVKDRKGESLQVFEDARKAGFVRVRVDGQVRDLGEEIPLAKTRKHTIEVVVDRLVIRHEPPETNPDGEPVNPDATRIADSIETALKLGGGVVLVQVLEGPEHLFSEHFACPYDGFSLPEIEPRSFSFNSPHGACPGCTGLGTRQEIDPELVVPNPELSLSEGAIVPWQKTTGNNWFSHLFEGLGNLYGFSPRQPFRELNAEQRKIIYYGTGNEPIKVRYNNRFGQKREFNTTFEGIIPQLERRFKETESDYVRSEIERYMVTLPCPTCQGRRLKPEVLAVRIGDQNIADVVSLSVTEARAWVDRLGVQPDAAPLGETHDGPRPGQNGSQNGKNGSGNGHQPANDTGAGESILTRREHIIANQIVKEIRSRLGFLIDVGLEYLTLDRAAATLSGGEAQRIRLATQIGSTLMGVLYVCDEPSIGLHPVDGYRLIETLKKLRSLGNTLLIVEHDEAMMRAADYLIDMGPGAGEHGGRVVAAGTVEDIERCPESLTGQYLSGAKQIPVPEARRPGNGLEVVIHGARSHNLKNIDVAIPLGTLVCVTGVSGSGKSTLINEILHRRLAQYFYRAKDRPGAHDAIAGIDHLDKVVNIDQSPIGRTPRSNPATYTGAFTPIRELFATMPEARARGYLPGRFSFNVKGGRCEACRGEGYVEIEMHFLPDITVPCEVCKGQRYNREALEIKYKGKSIAEVLDLTVSEALVFFDSIPKVRNKLDTLEAVGLGYMKVGQPATTLSGGEAQRVKLATELSKRATGKTMYILDEPTTGLAFSDVASLLQVLQRLVDNGNTVVLIEHHLDLIKAADWVIDLGPHGGERGGRVIATGTPEEIAAVEDSFTGQYLRPLLAGRREPVGAGR